MTTAQRIREQQALDVAVTKSVMDEQITTAERGALFMDEHFPGWFKRINLKTFDITDANQCVLGQRFRRAGEFRGDDGYAFGCRTLTKLGIGDDADLGFSVHEEDLDWDGDVRTAAWQNLQAEWVRLISDRKEAAKLRR